MSCRVRRATADSTDASRRSFPEPVLPRWLALASAKEVVEASRQGDAEASADLADYCDRLARGLATIINVLDPDAIVLGGGMSNVDELYTQTPSRWDRYVFSDRVQTPLLKNTHGDSSGVRGAAWLVGI